MANDSIYINLEFVTSKNNKTFKKVEENASHAGVKAGRNFSQGFKKSTSTGIASLAKNFIGVGLAITGARKALQGFNESLNNMRKFNKGVAEINTLLPKTGKLTAHARQELIEFSRSFGTEQQNQARAFYNIVSAGVKGTEKQLKTLATANKAAVAGLVDIDTSAKVIVSSVNAYSKAGLTATEASDALFVAVREGQTTFGELANSIGNVAPVASAAGLTFGELTGSIAGITKAGIKTDIAVTGIRALLSSLIKVTPEAAAEAKRLGLEFGTSAVKGGKLVDFLDKLQKATKGNEVSLGKLFPNVRALTPILQVVNGDFEDFTRIQKEVANAGGATNLAFKIMRETTDFKFAQANAEMKAFGLNLLNVLNPALREIAETGIFVGKVINSIFKKDSTKKANIYNKQLTMSARKINALRDAYKNAKNNHNAFTKVRFEETHKAKEINASIDAEMKKRQEIRNQMAGHAVNHKKELADLVQSEKDAKAQIAMDALKADELSKSLVANTSEFIVEQEGIKLQRLQELRNADLISEQMLSEARIGVRAQTEEQLNAIAEQGLKNSKATFSNLAKAAQASGKKIKFSLMEVASIGMNVIGKGLGKAFHAMGAAMKSGENGLKAFTEEVKNIFGDLASALGDYYIKVGIAEMAATYGAKGGATVAAGFGLKTLAGLLGAGAGSSAGGSSGGGGASTATGTLDDTGVLQAQDREERAPSTNVEVVVQGSLVQQEELGNFITDTLNESFGKQGVTLTDARFA